MPTDLRARELAKIAVKYSVKVKPGEKVIISGGSESLDFITELYKQVILAKAIPILKITPSNLSDFFYKYADEKQLKHFPDYWFNTVQASDCYIGIHTESNTRELTSSDSKKITTRKKILKPISDYINNERSKIKRVVIAYPCSAHAQESSMSFTEWENFVYQSCLINWKKFSKKLNKVKKQFKKGSLVHLIGKDVDLKFQVHGSKAVLDDGQENMPGGEVFMAPLRESLNGYIKFEYPRIVSGKLLSGVYLKFQDGKVVESSASEGEELLKSLLETDENSSYIGELGIGCNPMINQYTNNLLFDEKISGTIHLALGMAYKENGGGNDSAIHVDIVKDMKNSKIIVDGRIIQENGKWKI